MKTGSCQGAVALCTEILFSPLPRGLDIVIFTWICYSIYDICREEKEDTRHGGVPVYTTDAFSAYPYFRDVLDATPGSVLCDPLTGVLSRAVILSFVQETIRVGRSFALLLIDLDNFKAINDNYGHRTGDAVLSQTGENLRRFIGRDGLVGRYGGDEFLVVCFGPTAYDALHAYLMDMFHKSRVFRNTLSVCGAELFVTATVGAAVFPGDADSFDGLFSLIDKALYRGKSKGRNCFIIYVAEKHAHLEIPQMADKSLYDTFVLMGDGFDRGSDLLSRLQNAFSPIRENLRLERLFYLSPDGSLVDTETSRSLGPVERSLSPVQKRLYAADTPHELNAYAPRLSALLQSLGYNTVLIASLGRPDAPRGYLLFCPEPHTMHLWQDRERAAAYLLVRMLTHGQAEI